MDTTRLRHIVAVADTGSFSRAAELQAITQPALSRSIAAFERDNGLRLFDRDRAGARITPAGAFVVARARELLRASDELSRDIRLYAKGAAGRVNFGIGPLLASMLLPGLGPRLLAQRTRLEVSSVVRPPDALLGDLMDDTLEMVFGTSWHLADVPGIAAEELARLELALVVRAGHPLASGGSAVSAADIAAWPSARPSRYSEERSHAGAFICDNFHVLRETVLASDCTWITAPAFVREELAEGRLVRLALPDLNLAGSAIAVFTRRGRSLSPAANAVIGLVREALQAIDNPALEGQPRPQASGR